MQLQDLNESIKQYEIEQTLMRVRSDTMLYVNNGLRGASAFETGLCYEFAYAMYKFLKSQGERPELIFLVGNMKKAEAQWFKTEEFDPSTEHPFHALIKVRKYYYDINGRLGNKRDIKAMWSSFRRKKVVVIEEKDIKKYAKNQKVIKAVISSLENNKV